MNNSSSASDLMQLKILLPYKVFAELNRVVRMVVETTSGSYGILPHRLDGTAALVPGILEYETVDGDVIYIAVDKGILVKYGTKVMVSVRNAVGGAPLGQLRSVVEEEMMKLDESEVSSRSAMARLESGFIRSFQDLVDD